MNTISDLGLLVKELENLIRNGHFALIKDKCSEIYGVASIAEEERKRDEGNQMLLAAFGHTTQQPTH